MISLKLALLLWFSFVALHLFSLPLHALNLGIQADANLRVNRDCSRTCESKFCTVAPFLRYGKYCGILYSGCPGEIPCDGLDACCMNHDACIKAKNNDYLNEECNLGLRSCVLLFQRSGAHTFPGNTCSALEVIGVITKVMDAAVFAGRFFNISDAT